MVKQWDSSDRLINACKEIIGKYDYKIIDVTNYESIKTTFDEIIKKFGTIDYLFNNAGVGGTLEFKDASLQHWNKIINLNLYGVINGMTAIYPIMKKQKHGYIVNTQI